MIYRITFVGMKYPILIMVILFFISCQKESIEEKHSTIETITTTSPLSTFYKRIAMKNTTNDDIVDNSSCFFVKFLYTITLNNSVIPVHSESDFLYIEYYKNALNSDNDEVHFHFPITIQLSNYSERIINDQTAFNNLISECSNNTTIDSNKINCITINYPIVINQYNSDNLNTNSTTITNDKSLFLYLNGLLTNSYIAISYPINVSNENGLNTVITSNNQFELYVNNAIVNCNLNPILTINFENIITTGNWSINYAYDQNDTTTNYSGYNFIFNANKTVIATKNGSVKTGTWKTELDGSQTKFEVKFNSSPLNEIDEDWKIVEYSANQFHLSKRESNTETDYLYFHKN
jgi:hypothetical protein